jgi:uncharacterized protein
MNQHSPPTEAFTAPLVRHKFGQHFSSYPSVADGVFLRTWRVGPLAGQPKLPPAIQTMVARGPVEVRMGGRMAKAFFTEVGLAALQELALNRRYLDPVRYAHVKRELGLKADEEAARSLSAAPPAEANHGRITDRGILDRFLLSDAAPAESIELLDLDGFLRGHCDGSGADCAEWLPWVCCGEEPEFASAAERQTILCLIMIRRNDIVRALQSTPDDLMPIYWENEQYGTVIATDWAEGFLEAIGLRPEAWHPLILDKEAALLLMPILALGSEEAGDIEAGLDADGLLAEAPELIPICVFGPRQFWRGRGRRSSRGTTGRNDACLCGSGRKYKRCCGSN